MTSEPAGTIGDHATAYLDANVLVAGITRTLLLLSAPLSDFRAVWSPYAEAEAARHQPTHATPIVDIRRRHALTTVADAPHTTTADSIAPHSITLVDTDEKDKPILAAAATADACFVITENIKDFGTSDLRDLSMAAVHPDLFLATRLTATAYSFVLDTIAENRSREPKTAAGIHTTEVARKLPLLFAARHDDYGLPPTVPQPHPARLQFRGVRCIRCCRELASGREQQTGLGRECANQ